MNTRDQFGNYLLLKKLGEDALGETFRAGRIGRGTLERIVLLRVLNGQGLDGERIARSLQARAGLAQALKSPYIAQAIDVGQVRGVPYTAYDYSAGRSLAQLLEQAGRRSNPMPLDHALLIAERVALALAVAYETRMGEDRVQHGFVTPQMVQVSNEGELKLVGFEASAGLRESAAHPLIKQAIGRYMAPESLAGQAPSRADDVYSLGALLYEMVTGQLVPMMPPGGHGALLDQVVVAADGSHLPADLTGLLKRTLCPRDQRVADAVSWHKSLAKLMSDGGFIATTFNLAFLLHTLFREEIERESREIETEKSQAAALVASASPAPEVAPEPVAAAASAPSAVRSSGPVRDDSAVLREEYGLPQPSEGGNKNVLIAAGVGALVVVGVVGYLMFGRGGESTAVPATATPAETAATAPDAAAAPAAAPAPTGMTPEQIQALIAQALESQTKQIAAGQKSSDDQIKALQRQLEDAQRVRTAVAAVPAVAEPAATEPSALLESPAPAAAALPGPTPARTEPSPVPIQPTTTIPAPAAVKPAPVSSSPAPAPAAAVAGAPRLGDLVTLGPGVTSPRVVRQPPLNYPPVARRLKKEAVVSVRVLVDENGRVADAELTGSKVGFGMDEAAVSYARNCQFEPAKKAGVKVKVWYDIKVAFKL